MTSLLVLVQAYPSEGNPYQMGYVHARVKQYLVTGQPVRVLSFSATQDYQFEGVEVVTAQSAEQSNLFEAATVISHAPNLRNHFRMIFKQRRKIAKLVFVFHGHEVMHVPSEYPQPYHWNKKEKRQQALRWVLDPIKLKAAKVFLRYFSKQMLIKFIFVSRWMKETFERNIFAIGEIENAIINNPVSKAFSKGGFQINPSKGPLRAICIRPLDSSKYSIDLVLKLAQSNPNIIVDVYGKGQLPQVMQYGENVSFTNHFITQSEIPSVLNGYDLAILPTRLDAQGVSACEFASYGIPMITSDIPIMQEMLGAFTNVCFLPNDSFDTIVDMALIDSLKYVSSPVTDRLFDLESLVQQELAFINGD